jgi:hypothetical protein
MGDGTQPAGGQEDAVAKADHELNRAGAGAFR